MSDIISTDEVKSILNITSDSYDTMIETLIPIVQDLIIQYTKNDFEDGFPEGIKLPTAKIIGQFVKGDSWLNSEWQRGEVSCSLRSIEEIYLQDLRAFMKVRVI